VQRYIIDTLAQVPDDVEWIPVSLLAHVRAGEFHRTATLSEERSFRRGAASLERDGVIELRKMAVLGRDGRWKGAVCVSLPDRPVAMGGPEPEDLWRGWLYDHSTKRLTAARLVSLGRKAQAERGQRERGGP